MAKTINDARRPDATAGTDAIYRSLFDSFNPDSSGRISPLEVLSRLERSGLRPDDPRIAEALTGLAGADGGSRQISFTQFKALARRGSSLIRRAVEGNLAVPDFAALTADVARMHDELLPVRSGVVASLASVRFSLVSGGLLCIGAVAAVCAVLPGFVRYRAVTFPAAD